MSRITNDVDTVSSTLQMSVTQIVSSSIILVGVLIMMLRIVRCYVGRAAHNSSVPSRRICDRSEVAEAIL